MLEGNVSSGKTSFSNCLKHEQFTECFPEPLNKWSFTQTETENLFEQYLKDQDNEEKAFQFQLCVLYSYFFLAERISHCRQKYTLQERSILSCMNIFIPLLRVSKHKRQFLQNQARALFKRIQKPDLLIILESDPDTCMKRLELRNRSHEKYDFAYIEHNACDNFFMNLPLH